MDPNHFKFSFRKRKKLKKYLSLKFWLWTSRNGLTCWWAFWPALWVELFIPVWPFCLPKSLVWVSFVFVHTSLNKNLYCANFASSSSPCDSFKAIHIKMFMTIESHLFLGVCRGWPWHKAPEDHDVLTSLSTNWSSGLCHLFLPGESMLHCFCS